MKRRNRSGVVDNSFKTRNSGFAGRKNHNDEYEDYGEYDDNKNGIARESGIKSLNEEKCEKLEGRNPVLEALKAGREINKILIASGERKGSINQIAAMAKHKGIVIQYVDKKRLDNISSGGAHQGVIAYVSPKKYVDVDDIINIAQSRGEPPFIVILDEITDPHNLGSILRTAEAAGVHGVIISKRRAVGLTEAVSKASAGAVEYVAVARVTNIAQTIEYLKKKNIWIVGTDASSEKPFYENDFTDSVALVVGSEGEGIRRLVREKCDFVVSIPMLGNITSLNAAVAASIIMYEVLRQRRSTAATK